jgi:hypothetical protein
MKRLIATTAVLAGAAALPAFAGAAPQAKIAECGGHAVTRPSSLVLFCADDGETLTKLHWSGWGKLSATATGYDLVKICVPDCAAGRHASYRADVKVSGLKAGRYTKLTVTFPSKRPSGDKRTERFNLTKTGPVLA